VLSGVGLEAGPGSIVAVHGANGSGKSTFLRLLAGVVSPDSGEIEVAGDAPGTGRTSLVPAGERMLNWRLSAAKNLAFFARLGGVPAGDLSHMVRSALESLDAGALGQMRVGRCSTGQRRRLAVAAGFVGRAPVVLLDEPMEDLDREGRAAVDLICRRWADAGGCVITAAPEPSAVPGATQALELGDVGARVVGGAR
jgi:ABC-type multidrug transport system ATPase subunit